METRTTAELVGQALAVARVADEADGWDEHGDEYHALLWRAAADEVGAPPLGLELLGSGDPVERAAGCELLGRASDQHEALRAGTATTLVALAEREREADVCGALARAIERTYDPRAVPVLIALAGHRDAEVREVVAGSFAGVLTGRPDGPDIHTLLALTRDTDPQVRNWATFTLGFQAEVDSPAIRAALWERTTDEFADAREEGIRGLARRHDPRAVPLLVELLDDPDGAVLLTFDAARIMGVPELLPALLAYDPDGTGVTAAVHACDPQRRGLLASRAWELLVELDRLRPDLGAAVSMNRFDPELSLDLTAAVGSPGYSVEALLARAGGSPLRAAELAAAQVVTTDVAAAGPVVPGPERESVGATPPWPGRLP
ncbi:hypothetical protein GCM10009665_54190 [Kitasatospora nipponensis]|uniref:HEAT repeat protein n=1 Tax=Kitasatospora nipponensis TaxID=258049 RepID=A0ABN1WN72_9ACTN